MRDFHMVVCVKAVPGSTEVKMDPNTNTIVRDGKQAVINPFDASALECALALKDDFIGFGMDARVTVVSMGIPATESLLRDCIARGADDALLLTDRAFAGADTLATTYALKCGIEALDEDFDLLICGKMAVDGDTAQAIFEDLISNGYVKRGVLTDKYYADKANGAIQVAEEVADSRDSVISILDSVYDSRAMQPENARDKNVELQVDPDKLAMPEFKALWKRISPKSVYVVDFDTDELVKKAITSLNQNLHVPKFFFKVETGAMDKIKSKDSLLDGSAFSKSKSSTYDSSKQIRVGSSVKYDLIGKLVGETGLTRKAVVAILTGIEKPVFEQFKFNPEEFIIKAAALINDEKATAIIQHITYNVLDEHYDTDIFTEPTIKGKLGTNAMKAQRHLYDHIVYDSTNERDFAADLDTNTDVAVYVKLPDSFYIATPVGHYNPDWAIAFYEGTVKHIYFVAETKGSMSSMQLRLIEESKIHCAREHFKAISNGNVVYDVVDSYQALLEKVMK